MNVRQPPEMLRSQQNIPQLTQVPPHFLPSQQPPPQQQPPQNHIGLMSNAPNPSMAMLASGVQNNANSTLQSTAARFQMRQPVQQPQNPQMNTSAPPPGASHMPQLGHNPLQSMGFPAGMMQQGINGVQVRRVQSHPQGLNQAASHVPAMHPAQPSLNGINMSITPQSNIPAHLRSAPQQSMVSRLQSSIPGSISPDLMGRQPSASSVPQNPLRAPSAQSQIMNSLPQPPGMPQAGLQQPLSQNSFQPSVPGHTHHPSSLTSSPRPGAHSQQQHATSNMIMGQPGSSQQPGRPMAHPDNAFVGLQNNHFPQNLVPGSGRILNPGAAFSFVPPVSQNDSLEIPQSISEGRQNTSTAIRSSFQPTGQQFEQLQQNDNFGGHFVSQSNPPPPTRPPSHPSTAHGNSVPPRQMPPPHRHSPSDPMAGHIQQQPQRPQSQPQGPPGRPPSQAGPSHTPRSSQSQLPSSSGLLTSARITPHTQPQSSPHLRRQSPSVQQPIAPRPSQGPTSNSPATNATPSEASSSQGQPPVLSRHPVAIPVGLGQGLVRLLQFSGHLSTEDPLKHQLSFWTQLVHEYFTSRAIMKVTLWKDNQRNEAKPFEIGVPILPRFFLVTTQSGVKSMTLSLDGARERLVSQHHAVVECVSAVWTYKYTNGYTVTLRGPLTVHVLFFPSTAPTPTQPQAPFALRFDHLQFDAHTHEKFISLDGIVGQRTVEAPTPCIRNLPTPSPNGASVSQREEERQWDDPRILIENASIPGEPVNAFGIPQATMRCLELAESVSQMTYLIAFANETHLGPMDALSALAKKLREEAHNPTIDNTYIGLVPSGGGPGSFQGYRGPPSSALYPGMPPIIPIHSITSGNSPQNIPPPPSADTPPKQSKLPTSGPAPPAPNQPPAPQAGLTSTPMMTAKRKPDDTNTEPQSKKRKQKRNG